MDLGDRLFTGRVNIRNIWENWFYAIDDLSEGYPFCFGNQWRLAVRVTIDVGCCRELLEGREDDNLGDCRILCATYLYRASYNYEDGDYVLDVLKMGKIARKTLRQYQYPVRSVSIDAYMKWLFNGRYWIWIT